MDTIHILKIQKELAPCTHLVKGVVLLSRMESYGESKGSRRVRTSGWGPSTVRELAASVPFDWYVCGFEYRKEAERAFQELSKRFREYGLTIHPKKSRLVQFSRPYWNKGKGPGTFDFLGFTHYWGKTRAGGWTIKRMTQKKRLRRFMRDLWEWCKEHRHVRITEQHQTLCAKLRGHYQYYGIRGNYKMLEVVFEYAERTWRRWLGRRTRNGKIVWEVFEDRYRKVFPLPRHRIIHAF